VADRAVEVLRSVATVFTELQGEASLVGNLFLALCAERGYTESAPCRLALTDTSFPS